MGQEVLILNMDTVEIYGNIKGRYKMDINKEIYLEVMKGKYLEVLNENLILNTLIVTKQEEIKSLLSKVQDLEKEIESHSKGDDEVNEQD